MKRLIEIDDKWVPAGYEPVAFRRVVYGDAFLIPGNTPGKNSIWTEVQDVGPVALIIREVSLNVSRAHIGSVVLVSNDADGPMVQRVLVDVTADRDYPFVCESIDPRLPHQCWRFAKRVDGQVVNR